MIWSDWLGSTKEREKKLEKVTRKNNKQQSKQTTKPATNKRKKCHWENRIITMAT
jgi:hypothetical protein